MNVSDSWRQFEKLWNKKFGQLELSFSELEKIETTNQTSDKKE